jgi:surface antigen
MWRQLTPGERAKFLGTTFIGFGLLALAVGLIYLTYTLVGLLQTVPAILAQVEQTSAMIDPIVQEVDKVQAQIPPILKEVRLTRELVPPILKEVRLTRDLVPPILKEVGAVREQLPAVLAEVAAVRKEVAAVRAALPPLVETAAKSIQQASDSVQLIDQQIPPILSEVRQTREALPGLLDRADQLVANAGNVGRKASQGAVTGVLGGIIIAPFRLLGEAGQGLASAMKLDPSTGFTPEDDRLATEATDAVIKTGQIGAQRNWQNPASKNSGTVTLLDQKMRDGEPCFKVKQFVALSSGKTHSAELLFCQHPDGTWAAEKN